MKTFLIIVLCFSLTLSLSLAEKKNEDNSEERDNSDSSSDDSSSSSSSSSSGSSGSTSSSETITNHFASVDISRHEGESDEEYYKRIVVKYADESNEEHEVRIQFLKVLLPKLSIWTDNKYKEYVSTSTRRTTTTETTTTTTTTTVSESTLERKQGETEEAYYKRILVKRSGESGQQYFKRISELKKKLPNLEIWSDSKFTDFLKSHVVTTSSGSAKIVTRRKTQTVNQKRLQDIEKRSDETDEAHCNRIFKRYADESVKEYKQRVKEMQKRLPNLQVWKNDEYKKYVNKYTTKTTTKTSSKSSTKEEKRTEVTVNTKYLSDIEQRSSESKEEYYKRIFEKHSDENDKQYKKRVEEIKKRLPNLDVWKGNQYKKYTKQYTVVSRSKRSTVTVVNRYLRDIEQRQGESEETYYQRIFKKHSDESNDQYRKRIDEMKKKLPNLKCWKDNKYQEYTSVYRSRVVIKYMDDIKKKDSESEETYYKRIFQKHNDESKKQYRKRIEELKKELPDLAVWKNNKYEEYTKEHTSGGTSVSVVTRYMKDIKKKDSESEEKYYQRIFKRHSDENTKQYKNRIEEMKKQLSDLQVWKDNKYVEYTKDYKSTVVSKYLTDIEKKESENDESHYQRIFKKHDDENKKQYKNRVQEMKRQLPKLKVWQNNEYEKYTKAYVTTTETTTSSTTRSTRSTTTSSSTTTSENVIEKYLTDIEQHKDETKEAYYTRIFKKQSDESDKQYEKRVEEMRKRLHTLDVWQNDGHKKYTQVHVTSSKSDQLKSHQDHKSDQTQSRQQLKSSDTKGHQGGSGSATLVTRGQIDFTKHDSETEEAYCERILQKYSDESYEEYEKRVEVMKKEQPTLVIWRNDKYKEHLKKHKENNSGKVEKRSVNLKNVQIKHLDTIERNNGETDEVYYKRILQKHSDETNEEYEERINVMKEKLSHLEIWKSNEYKKYVSTDVKSSSTTTTSASGLKHTENINIHEGESEQSYYVRILKKHSDESSEEYSQRLQFMMKNLSHLPIWQNNEYVKYQETKQYSEGGSSVNTLTYTEVVKENHQEKHSEQQSVHSEKHSEQQSVHTEKQSSQTKTQC